MYRVTTPLGAQVEQATDEQLLSFVTGVAARSMEGERDLRDWPRAVLIGLKERGSIMIVPDAELESEVFEITIVGDPAASS